MTPKLNIHVLHDLEIPLLCKLLREMNVHIPQKTCPRVFIAAPFIVAKNWKQLKY